MNIIDANGNIRTSRWFRAQEAKHYADQRAKQLVADVKLHAAGLNRDLHAAKAELSTFESRLADAERHLDNRTAELKTLDGTDRESLHRRIYLRDQVASAANDIDRILMARLEAAAAVVAIEAEIKQVKSDGLAVDKYDPAAASRAAEDAQRAHLLNLKRRSFPTLELELAWVEAVTDLLETYNTTHSKPERAEIEYRLALENLRVRDGVAIAALPGELDPILAAWKTSVA